MPHSRAYASARSCVAARDGDQVDLRRLLRARNHLPVDVRGRDDSPFDGCVAMSPTIAEVAEIGIGMLGYAFMGKAHSNAFKKIAYITWPPPLEPRLVGIAGRNDRGGRGGRAPLRLRVRDRRLAATSSRTTASGSSTTAARTRCTPSRRSRRREAGKHVVCEKPLGRDADESYEIWRRVAATGVKHLCAFNYRFVPAVRLAREMIDAGELGEIRHFRGRYLQDWGDDPSLDTWRFDPDAAGSGALGDLMAHVVDLARFLNGELATVVGLHEDVPAGPHRSTTRSRRRSSSRTARSGRSRRRASRTAAATRSSGRSTARRARSPSTWSA